MVGRIGSVVEGERGRGVPDSLLALLLPCPRRAWFSQGGGKGAARMAARGAALPGFAGCAEGGSVQDGACCARGGRRCNSCLLRGGVQSTAQRESGAVPSVWRQAVQLLVASRETQRDIGNYLYLGTTALNRPPPSRIPTST